MKFNRYIAELNGLYTVKLRRLAIAKELFQSSIQHAGLKPLTADQENAIAEVWGSQVGKFDPRWFQLYHYIHPEIGMDIAGFMPLDFFLAYVDPQLVDPQLSYAIDDKNLYSLLFPDIRQPRTIARFISGICLNEQYQVVEFHSCVSACRQQGRVIVKPATVSCGGRGIFVWDAAVDTEDRLEDVLRSGNNYVIQELVCQHPVMAKSNSSSCNTIRVMTMLIDGKVHVFPHGYTRMGGSGSVIDNISSGGYYAGVYPDGRIGDIGRDHWQRVVRLEEGDRVVPNYQRCLDLAAQAAPRLAQTARLVSWDFAIDHSGEPILIEVNLGRTDFQSFQSLFGPYFKDWIPYFQSISLPVHEGKSHLMHVLDNILSHRLMDK